MPRNPLHKVFPRELRLSREKTDMLDSLRVKIEESGCTGCKLHEHRGQQPVPGEGKGRIMFVGHRIGGNEARSTKPAIGPASLHGFELFMNVLPCDNSGIPMREQRDYVLQYAYVSNAARCAPSESPTTGDWKRCAGPKGPNWLSMEMGLVDPKIVVFWNKQAARAVLHEEPPPRGEIQEMNLYGQKRHVMLMVHPVNVAREPEEKTTVEGDYKQLIQWLSDQGLMKRDPDFKQTHEANYHLVTTQDGLDNMLDDLWDKEWIGLDTETFFSGDIEYLNQLAEKSHEVEKGALLWYHPNFEAVCYQLCGLSWDREGREYVEDSWTVAMRFRNRMTGEPFQDISPEEAIDALDQLLRHSPAEGSPRKVCMWNALFDCPVLTREGIDAWGMTHQDYDMEVLDGQIYLGRLNEHMGGKEGRTTLDNAANIYMQERKGSFTDRFDVATFANEDITNPDVREDVLEYCCEDPRKTVVSTHRILEDLQDHYEELNYNLTDKESNMPVMGFSPFPRPNQQYTGDRMQDVAIPLDHQMIPLIGEMEMLGFKLDRSGLDESKKYVDKTTRMLRQLIQDEVPGFNPNSAPDTIGVMERAMRDVAGEINRLCEKYPGQRRELLRAFQINPNTTDEATADDIEKAFSAGYGELNAQKPTIKNQWLVFYEVSLRVLKEKTDELGAELNIEDRNKPVRLKLFFEQVFIYKQIEKKWGTYFERFMDITDRESIIHPYYLLISTLSGRLSGNFQNVPRGGEEDLEFIADMLEAIEEALDFPLPENEEEMDELVQKYNRFDVRQACYAIQPEDLNPTLERMNLRYQEGPKEGQPWQVREDDDYVFVTADFAAQEDRMAYALSGDETKARLLSNPELDTHFYNVAFCFGAKHGFDTSTEEGMMNAYHNFTKQRQTSAREQLIRKIVEEADDKEDHGLISGDEYVGDINYAREDFEEDPGQTDLAGRPVEEAVEFLRDEIDDLKSRKKEFKKKYRTPMKTVHYASQYGAGATKLHTVIKPIFLKIGEEWTLKDTEELKEKYDELYEGVTEAREEIIENLEQVPFVEYPVYGTLRHASVDYNDRVQDQLSVANALNQGTCAYITKTAMLRMRHLIQLNAERWNLLQAGGDTYVGIQLQVHDEIAVYCPARLATEVAHALESAMKMAVRPGHELPYYSDDVPDARGDHGWLVIPDEGFEGETLFDADAEIKRTAAKAKTLASGERNLLALMDEPETMEDLREKYPPKGINKEHDLTLARKGEADGYLI